MNRVIETNWYMIEGRDRSRVIIRRRDPVAGEVSRYCPNSISQLGRVVELAFGRWRNGLCNSGRWEIVPPRRTRQRDTVRISQYHLVPAIFFYHIKLADEKFCKIKQKTNLFKGLGLDISGVPGTGWRLHSIPISNRMLFHNYRMTYY